MNRTSTRQLPACTRFPAERGVQPFPDQRVARLREITGGGTSRTADGRSRGAGRTAIARWRGERAIPFRCHSCHRVIGAEGRLVVRGWADRTGWLLSTRAFL